MQALGDLQEVKLLQHNLLLNHRLRKLLVLQEVLEPNPLLPITVASQQHQRKRMTVGPLLERSERLA
jgi:hypothetical protein